MIIMKIPGWPSGEINCCLKTANSENIYCKGKNFILFCQLFLRVFVKNFSLLYMRLMPPIFIFISILFFTGGVEV